MTNSSLQYVAHSMKGYYICIFLLSSGIKSMSHHARQKHDILKCPYEDKFPKEGGFFKTGWAVMSHDSSRITHNQKCY